MIDWLLKISGKSNDQNMERAELIELRKEVAKLKKRVRHDLFSTKKMKNSRFSQIRRKRTRKIKTPLMR